MTTSLIHAELSLTVDNDNVC